MQGVGKVVISDKLCLRLIAKLTHVLLARAIILVCLLPAGIVFAHGLTFWFFAPQVIKVKFGIVIEDQRGGRPERHLLRGRHIMRVVKKLCCIREIMNSV